MLLNNQLTKDEIKQKIKNYLRQMKIKTQLQNLWYTVKAQLRGKFIAMQAYHEKQENSQINNLMLHLRKLL